MRRFLSSRKVRLVIALALAAGLALAARDFGLLPRGLPDAGVLVVDLRHGLPDKTESPPHGLRSVSATDVLRALDAARADRRIAGVYLRVGSRAMPLAQAMEIADAVTRLRRAGKFALVYAEAFTAANFGDRVLAASADEIWTPPEPGPLSGPDARIVNPAPGELAWQGPRGVLWAGLLEQAAARIAASSPPDGADPGSAVDDAVARAGRLPAAQYRRGTEARAELSALAWGGAGAGFVDLLTWRETLDRRDGDAPFLALVQAEGIVAAREGPGPRDLAGPLAARIKAAARDRRVKGVIVRISAVTATDDSLAQLLRTAEAVRRAGTPVGVSFGPVLPVPAARLRSRGVPLFATAGALLVDVKEAEAASLAEAMRFPWRAEIADAPGAARPAEAAFLERNAVVASVDGAAGRSAPQDGANAAGVAFTAQGWPGEVGTLLALKDRLTNENGRALPMRVYAPEPSVPELTLERLTALRRQMEAWARDLAALVASPAPERGGE